MQILRSDWLSHRALFVIVHDEHKQDGGRAFLQSFACNRRNIVHNKLFELFCLQISTKTNSILALVVSERIVNSAAPRLLSAHRPLELVYYLLNSQC